MKPSLLLDANAHFYVEIITDEGLGDSIELLEDVDQCALSITVSCPWNGDSQSGFGQDCTATMNRAQAVQLRDAIDRWLTPL